MPRDYKACKAGYSRRLVTRNMCMKTGGRMCKFGTRLESGKCPKRRRTAEEGKAAYATRKARKNQRYAAASAINKMALGFLGRARARRAAAAATAVAPRRRASARIANR